MVVVFFLHIEIKMFFFSYWFRNQNLCTNTLKDFCHGSVGWTLFSSEKNANIHRMQEKGDLQHTGISQVFIFQHFFLNYSYKFLKFLVINLCIGILEDQHVGKNIEIGDQHKHYPSLEA